MAETHMLHGMADKPVYAIVPAYNEERTIGHVVASISPLVAGVVVVNDGSSDGTALAAKRNGAIVLDRGINLGYDKSIQEGFEYLAAINGVYAAVTFDADGQHLAHSLAAVVSPLLDGRSDVAVGIRPWRARVSEKLLAMYTSRKYGIVDPLCGLKAYRMDVYKDIGFFDRMGSVGTELMVRAVKKGYRLSQVRIPLRLREGRSRFGQSVKANYKIMRALVKLSQL